MSKTMLPPIERRRVRTRSKITGSANRPRLNVFVSNKHITAQLIDDDAGRTLASVTTVKSEVSGNMTAKAEWVGSEIGGLAAKKKIKSVVFDRGGRVYHGRLHALAEAARAKGLEF